ncbi:MAG: pilus assembly protein [Gemmataceae bacterium]|nr:pilus assembly protein [Gemmataceae bacterium]
MKMSRVRAGRQPKGGQALVEFALVLPVMLLLIVGVLEFARAWNLHQALTDATREGARRAAVADSKMDSQDSVKAAVWRGISQAGYDPVAAGASYSVTITSSGGQWKKTGDNVNVDVRFPYRFWVLPFRDIMMRSTFTMRYE